MESEADKLDACLKENRDLVYVLSHDLREPLRMVTSYIDLFTERYRGQLDTAADEFMEYALDGARRAEWMLDGLLSYSRVVNQPVDRQTVSVGDVIQRAVDRLQVAYNGVSVGFECSSMPTLTCDRRLLSQLWDQLLDNAIKFRDPHRAVQIRVVARRHDGFWEFRVADNGIGFESRCADRIFNIFHSLHPVGRYPGVGVGLAISRRIVERLGGDMRAEGEPDKGAVFVFNLPDE